MAQRPVSDLIMDKFTKAIERDILFKAISDDLIAAVRDRKRSETGIEKILRTKQDENSKSGS